MIIISIIKNRIAGVFLIFLFAGILFIGLGLTTFADEVNESPKTEQSVSVKSYTAKNEKNSSSASSKQDSSIDSKKAAEKTPSAAAEKESPKNMQGDRNLSEADNNPKIKEEKSTLAEEKTSDDISIGKENKTLTEEKTEENTETLRNVKTQKSADTEISKEPKSQKPETRKYPKI